MSIKKKIFMVFIVFNLFIILMPFVVSAHTSNLGIDGYNGTTYDDCIKDDYASSTDIGDGYDEKWYELVWDYSKSKNETCLEMHHVDDDIDTLYYQFQSHSYDNTSITWDTNYELYGNACKVVFEESMLKWNNVYYYKLNDEGIYEKHKIINLVNYDSLSDKSNIVPNILIYPFYDESDEFFFGKEEEVESSIISNDTKFQDSIGHKHYTQFRIFVNTYILSVNPDLLKRTGAHEVGHILGLSDIDDIENMNNKNNYHHEELLMGYSKGESDTRQKEITYKDIAGVAITRGFHTDSDHIWLYDEKNPKNNEKKLICSLCNCVKYVSDLENYDYYIYEQCGHKNKNSITVDENMIPVASYGDTDYYKCKYCRYVAPFTSRITQNYVYCGERNNSKHILENTGNNLNYKISENHIMNISLGDNNYKCSVCEYRVVNTFEEYNLSNNVLVKETVSINENVEKYFKINVDAIKKYYFSANGLYNIKFKLYDEYFNEILYNDLDGAGNRVQFDMELNIGSYYLMVSFADSNNSGAVSIQIDKTPHLNIGNNNILSGYIHNVEDYVYTNNNSAGFYKLTLNATKTSGTMVYPEGCIKVYADEAKQQLLARLETIFYTLNAETQGDSNNLIVFLEYGQPYYINIDLPNASYLSVYINIERLTNTYDIVESNNAEEHVILNENTTAYGDFIQRVEIHETGTYTITFIHEGPQSEENLMGQENPLYLYYAFYKEVYSPAEQFGDLEMIFPHIASSMGGTISFTFNLQPGVYYIGYYNKLNNEPMSIIIN